MKKLLLIWILCPVWGVAQLGGQLAYQALNLTNNPRAAALGGMSVSLADGDVSQFWDNPAILDSVEAGQAFFQINPYFADVMTYTGVYSFSVKDWGNFAAGIHYINYGDFELTDDAGNTLGSFNAQDYVVAIGKAHQLGIFTLGTNLKLAHSSIESFESTTLLLDIGGVARVNKNWTVAMVFENLGVKLTDFGGIDEPSLPFDVRLGTSFKPEYMPLRFTLTTNSLVRQNERTEDDAGGRSTRLLDDVWKRVNIGAEVLLSENFQLLVGYNHKRKQELRLEQVRGGAGLSFGAMVRIKRIELRFSRATFHAAGGSSFISVRTDLNDFKKIL